MLSRCESIVLPDKRSPSIPFNVRTFDLFFLFILAGGMNLQNRLRARLGSSPNNLFGTIVNSRPRVTPTLILSSLVSWPVTKEAGARHRCARCAHLWIRRGVRLEFRHENHRGPIVYPITETPLCGISRVWAHDSAVSIKHSLWHRARAVDSTNISSRPFIYLVSSTSPLCSSSSSLSLLSRPYRLSYPPHCDLIDATRFLRVITAALESDRFNLPVAI